MASGEAWVIRNCTRLQSPLNYFWKFFQSLIWIFRRIPPSGQHCCWCFMACYVLVVFCANGHPCTHERHLVCSDISFQKNVLNVIIRAPQKIQFADRTLELPIPRAKPSNVLCPVQAMLLYVQGPQSLGVNGPLFIISNGYTDRPLTAALFAQRLKYVLSSIGVNKQSYATHSCRRGGASWAYRLDVPVDTIKVIGDWKSLAYQRYIVTERPLITHAMQRMVDGVAFAR